MLTYDMDRRPQCSRYEYLYRCIRRDIEAGAIPAGEKLPSKRALARHLGISVITVEAAYSQLVAEGYVRAEERRGYFAESLPVRMPSQAAALANSSTASVSASPALPASSGIPIFADFASAAMPAGLFPFNAWVKAMREALSREPENLLLGDTPACGLLRLRQAIANYLRGFRGMEVDPDCVVVGAGAQVLYNMIVQLLGRDLRYAVEDPGYPRLTSIYRANDAEVRHVRLDSGGISVAALAESGANVAHIMPSHQFPTGLVTSAARRFELLEWAHGAPDRYLVEDDYDCEFRFSGRPVPSLASIDLHGRVIYTNTFTKTLGPAFRIGYMILPPHLAQQFASKLGFYSCTVSAVDQLALARFMEGGAYERHVNRMRKHCKTLKEELVRTLRSSEFGNCLQGRLHFEAADAGLHFVMAIDGVEEGTFAQAARAEGVALAPLSAFCAQGSVVSSFSAASLRSCSPAPSLSPSADSHLCARFVMNYAGIDSAAIPRIASALARALRGL